MSGTIKSVEKALDLLFLFDGDQRVIDVKTIANTLHIPLRTTYRFLNTLRNRGALILDEGAGLCRVGPRWRNLLAAIEDSGNIAPICKPFLVELAQKSGETAQLFIPHGDEALLIEIAESPHPLRVGPAKGQRIPLHCGAGAKAIFALQSPDKWDDYIRRNGLAKYAANTVTDPTILKDQLREILRTRFAVSHQEFIPHVISLAVPLQDATGLVTASLGLVGPDTRLTRKNAPQLKPLMFETAQKMLRAICGRST